MQPLKASVSPSSESTMGCWPRSDRSMILRRLWPKATRPRATMPSASGPRGAIEQVMAPKASKEAGEPSNVISPHKPHIAQNLGLVRSLDRPACIREDTSKIGAALREAPRAAAPQFEYLKVTLM